MGIIDKLTSKMNNSTKEKLYIILGYIAFGGLMWALRMIPAFILFVLMYLFAFLLATLDLVIVLFTWDSSFSLFNEFSESGLMDVYPTAAWIITMVITGGTLLYGYFNDPEF